MSTASRPASEVRGLGARLLLAGFLALAPSRVPLWRLDPTPRAAAVLAVGDPTRSLWVGRG